MTTRPLRITSVDELPGLVGRVFERRECEGFFRRFMVVSCDQYPGSIELTFSGASTGGVCGGGFVVDLSVADEGLACFNAWAKDVCEVLP